MIIMNDATGPDGLPVMTFADAAAWQAWLVTQPAAARGAWLRFAKKGTALTTVTYADALDTALCYGWIDGQKRTYDTASFLIRFTLRGSTSVWSQVNRTKAEALIAAGRMQPAGQAAIARAQANGRWDTAYAPASRARVPEDLRAALDANPAAAAFFATLTGNNRYAILYRVTTTRKPATRSRKIAEFVAMLERGETLH